MKKIIILASERSGTNLLRTLLGNHKHICAPVAPHFFDAFRPNIHLYGDLNKATNAEKLLDHMIRLSNHKYNDWQLDSNASSIREKFNVNSLQSAFDALYAIKTESESSKHYACKDNHMFNHAFLLETLNKGDEIHYIYLYRDPRDHIASWLRTPLFMHTPIAIARKWNREQQKIIALEKSYGLHLSYLKYEDLIDNPQESMTKLLNDLNLEVDENCFNTDNKNIESKRNEFWKNLSKPIMKSNTKKYEKYLKGQDLLIVESVCKKYMSYLGYDLDTAANWVWKKNRGYGTRLKIRAAISRKKNKDLFDKKMADLKDKLNLLDSFKKELK